MNEKIIELKKNYELLENTEDEDFRVLIAEEIAKLEDEIMQHEPEDKNNAIIEIRAGSGGEESELFAAQLARMYVKFAERLQFKVTVNDNKQTSIGGTKEFIATITGSGAYGLYKYEAGVHRVQRVPETEKKGRIHTSAATVAVLPEIEEKEVTINPLDLKIDVYRSGGHGGQSVNTTDSAVRITHLPSGLVVTCQDERSQLKNKAKAMTHLRSRLWQANEDRKRQEQSDKRLTMVMSGDRSDKIRTYNFPQDRITDHRIPKSWNNMQKILDGDLETVIDELKSIERKSEIEKLLSGEDFA
jgi:peptide chain release factor 1